MTTLCALQHAQLLPSFGYTHMYTLISTNDNLHYYIDLSFLSTARLSLSLSLSDTGFVFVPQIFFFLTPAGWCMFHSIMSFCYTASLSFPPSLPRPRPPVSE